MAKRTLINSHSLSTSIVLSALMFLMLGFMLFGPNLQNQKMLAASGVYLIFLVIVTFLMYRTGRIARYRSLFFSVYAIGFVITFIPMLLETRGHIGLTAQDIANLNTPLCHLTIPMLIVPGVVYGILIFPTKLFAELGFFPMLFLWLGATVILGKGWCSWGCFFGGLDEFFSKLSPKRILSSKKFNYTLRFFPFALLLVIVVWAFMVFEPVYCTWLCPFKAVTEYVRPLDWVTWLQTGIFIVIFLGLVIVLPLLMKRRTQCGLFCPFGAWQSLVGLINPYRVRIDKERCNQCGVCVEQCPTFSITKETLARHKVSVTCVRCGRCMEICPRDGIQISIVGVPLRTRSSSEKKGFFREALRPDTLFVFGAIFFGGILSGGMVAGALLRIIQFMHTGSLVFK